jgi:iron complex transport system substrate-binding protein
MKKIILIILLFTFLVGLAAGCSNSLADETSEEAVPLTEEIVDTANLSITDMVGRTVEMPANVESIVALGNVPRMVTYLGLAANVVGYSGMQPDTITPGTAYAYATKDLWADVPMVGTDAAGANDYYPEEIIRVNPDVILCSYPPELADEIQSKTGIPVVSVAMGTLFGDDYEEALRLLAQVCGVPEKAEEVIAFINDCLNDLDARTASIPDVDNPTILGAAASFRGGHGIEGVYVNNRIFSAINANDVTIGTADTVGGMLVDREQIIGWDPEYIIFDSSNFHIVKEDYKNNPDYYAHLSAVVNGKLYQTPNATSYYTNLEIPLVTAYYVGNLIYPEQFDDLVFEDKANEIFKFFLGVDDFLGELEAFGLGYGAVTLGDN